MNAMKLFSSEPPRTRERFSTASANHAVLPVHLEIIGCEAGGKTLLQLSMVNNVGRYMGDLFLTAKDPLAFNTMRIEMLERLNGFTNQPMDPTVIEKGFQFTVIHRDEPRILMKGTDPIGQVFSNASETSNPEWLERYQNCVGRLANASVLHVVIPAVPTNSSLADRLRFDRNVTLASSYLQQALAMRDPDSPCAVAIVGTKIDILADSAERARESITEETLRDCFDPLVRMVQDSKRVRHAAIIPVSSTGFGTMRLMEGVTRPSVPGEKPGALTGAEPPYILKAGTMPLPFNVRTLLAWTLWAGALPQKVDPQGDDIPELNAVIGQLENQLKADDAWLIPIRTRSQRNDA